MLDDFGKDLSVFWVRNVSGDVGEISAGFAMRTVDFEVVKADFVQQRFNVELANTMQRRKDHFQISRPVKAVLKVFLHERRINLLGTHFDVARCDRFVKFCNFDLLDLAHFFDHRFIVRGNQLCAAGPVHFDRIITGWIVAGRDHDPAIAFFVTDQIGELGSAAIVI